MAPSPHLSAPLSVALDAGPLHGHRTGVGMMVAELSTALAARDDVRLRPYLISGRAEPHPGEHRLPLPGVVAAELWSRSSRPRADRWLGHVDIVHGTNFVAPPSRHPTLVTVHDCWFLEHPERSNPVVARAGRWLRRNVDDGAWVHTPSQATAVAARRLLGTDRVESVHLGPPAAFDVTMTNPKMTGHLTGPLVVAIGTEERRKGYPELVAAFALVAAEQPELRLAIAGASGDDSAAVSAAIDQLSPSMAGRISRLGPVDDSVKAWLLDNADVLAYPSLDEGFGFPLLEANRAHLPIVARAAGSIPEIAGNSAVLVDDGDTFIADFADALATTLDDDQRRAQLHSAGAANLERFSWHRCADQLTALYHKVIDAHS